MRYADSVEKAVALAEHYIAIGDTEINLFRYYSRSGKDQPKFDPSLPWNFVTKVKAGGSVRYNVDVDIDFIAEHPSGLTFRWSYYIEEGGLHESGPSSIDIEGLRKCLALIPRKAQLEVVNILRDNVREMNEQAQKQREWYLKIKQGAERAELFLEEIEKNDE